MGGRVARRFPAGHGLSRRRHADGALAWPEQMHQESVAADA